MSGNGELQQRGRETEKRIRMVIILASEQDRVFRPLSFPPLFQPFILIPGERIEINSSSNSLEKAYPSVEAKIREYQVIQISIIHSSKLDERNCHASFGPQRRHDPIPATLRTSGAFGNTKLRGIIVFTSGADMSKISRRQTREIPGARSRMRVLRAR